MPLKYIPIVCLLMLTACGGGGSSSGSTSKPTVAVNNPPVANNDTYNVGMNAATELDVLSNDTDNDSFSITSLTEPTNGVLTNNQSNVTYTPHDGFVGSDNFSYTIKDTAGQKSSAVVTVAIANIAPVAVNDTGETVQSQALVINVLENDSSLGGHELSIASTSSPNHGVVSYDGKLITYTPTEGYSGNDSFVYVVRDSYGDETTATVSVIIENVTPTATNDDLSLSQNSAVTIDVLANDVDAKGDNLELVNISNAEHGEATIANNKVTYTPNNGYVGAETLSYTIIDCYGATSQASLTLDITNITPTAADDSDNALKNRKLLIDVLANDIDVAGDALTIQSVSSPQHGSVKIVDGKVEYQPNTDYIGEDVFGYTVIDSYGASDSGFITVTVHNAIQLQGKLVGYEQAGLEIVLTAGEHESRATTDAQGQFTIDVGTIEENALVITKVVGAPPNYTMYAYFGDVASLTAQMKPETLTVENKHITDFTTAEYELIDIVREGKQATTLKELTTAQIDADNFYQLYMGVAVQLVNQNNGIELPEAFSTVNAFIKSTKQMNKQLAIWKESHNEIYHQAFNNLFTNDNLTQYPERLETGVHHLNESMLIIGSRYSFGLPSTLKLDANGGAYTSAWDDYLTMNWQQNDDRLIVSLIEASDWVGHHFGGYCPNGDIKFVTSDLLGFELTQLYSTTEFDVYLRKDLIRSTSSWCWSEENVIYTTVRHFREKPLDIEESNFLLNVVLPKINSNGNVSYSYKAAELILSDNGSFVDSNDENKTLMGSWSKTEMSLELNYDDYLGTLSFKKSVDVFGESYLNFSYVEEDKVLSTGSTIVTSFQDLTWAYTNGSLSFDIEPVLDDELARVYRYNFKEDNQGMYQYMQNNEWVDRTPFTWRIDGNTYYLDYYYDRENYTYVSYCDVTLDDCYISRTKEYEIISTQDEIESNYLIKYSSKSYNQEGENTDNYSSFSVVKFTPE